jgi:hypothetical protein
MNSYLKELKVLCVLKDRQILTRVVKQPSGKMRQRIGDITLKCVSCPELRVYENDLFLRGDTATKDHTPDVCHVSVAEKESIVKKLLEVNTIYHGKISL